MDNNEMKVQATVYLPSKKQIDEQIRALEKSIGKLKVSAALDDGALKNITNQLNSLKATVDTAHLSPAAVTELSKPVEKAFNKIEISDIHMKDADRMAQKTGRQIGQQIAESAQQAIQNNDVGIPRDDIELPLQDSENIEFPWTDTLKDAWEKLNGMGFATKLLTTVVNKTISSILELKEIDRILTKISNTSGQSVTSLRQLGDHSFEIASNYGRKAPDYLSVVQEMNRNGFDQEKGNAMAEQSLLAQSAGDMPEEIANQWILATNAAYQYEGEAKKINAVLDGVNGIASHNRISMTDMAEAMSAVGATASQAGIRVRELSSLVGTSVAATKKDGTEVGTAWNTLFQNLQNSSSDKIVKTLSEANASMTETKNGIEQLRNPIAILKDLAKTYNNLGETDPLKSKITTNIGGNDHAGTLDTFLTNYRQYEQMLNQYDAGTGSAMEAAQSNANNWEGSWNRVNNTITDIVENLLRSDSVIGGMNGFNALLENINQVTSSFEKLSVVAGTIGLTVLSQKKSGGLIRCLSSDNNSPFLATVECNSDVYDSYIYI